MIGTRDGLRLCCAATLVLLGVGCADSANDCELTNCATSSTTTGSGGSSGTGGEGGGTGGGGDGGGGTIDPGCVPSEASGAVGDECGVFVSSSLGDDANAGTKAKPKKTLAAALTAAKAASKPVYACAEVAPYPENVLVNTGATVFGALDCADGWAYMAANRTKVLADDGFALEIASASEAVRIEDFELAAADAVGAGASSIAAFVHDSADVTLRRVTLAAGRGVTGESGAVVGFNFPTQAELNGNDAVLGVGGATKTCPCPAGDQTSGGSGGDAPGQGGSVGAPDLGAGQGGVFGQACGAGGAGLDGNPGISGTNGAGASTLGTLAAVGWTPADGGSGLPGGPGQGGGGGASTAAAGGGSGGCGGCGGAGALGGKGGGASIALLSFQSSVKLEASELHSSDAGNGGAGVLGQAGQVEFGFSGNSVAPACDGGSGGLGAQGGSSGGGAGGISAGVVHHGDAPTLTETTITKGAAGAAGPGGNGNDGVVGASEDVLAL